MVCEGLAASRPGMSARLIVHGDDEFTHDHSVCKSDDSRVTFEFTVHYESRYQTLMDRAHVADRVSNKFFTSLDFNFFVDRRHSVLLRPCILPLPSGFYICERDLFGIDTEFAARGQRPAVAIERKRSHDAIGAAKARFEGILEIAEDAIISADSSQRTVLFNRHAGKAFGYAEKDAIGKSLDQLLPRG